MRLASIMLCMPLSAFAAAPVETDDMAISEAMHATMMEPGGMLNYLLLADRFERQYQEGSDQWLWDAQGWIGGDYDKLWVKSEGEWSDQLHKVERSELQLLYSHAITPFWDLQSGIRHDDGIFKSRAYGALGVQGLAPYWFEVDAAAFVSEHGDLQLHFAAEYELRLTQKLLLQPRLQLNHAFSNDIAAGIGQGMFDSNIALRLRYEFVREFAPYFGVERSIGSNRYSGNTRIVAGFRFWY